MTEINGSYECKFTIEEIKEESDPNYFFIEGWAAAYNNVDLGDDVIESNAFSFDLAKNGKKRPILWSHDRKEPIGIGDFEEAQKGLKVVIRLPKDDVFVTGRVMPQVRIKSVTGLSIGYSATNWEYEARGDTRIRRLKACELKETSIVVFPMNTRAQITAAKEETNELKAVPPFKNYSLTSEDTAWDSTRAIGQIRTKTDSIEKPSADYKNGFMYYDSANQENFTAYKLPYVYVVGGQFKVVPRALSAIVGAIMGARGGLNIPEADKALVKAQVNRYYEKMGRERPFKDDGKVFIDINTFKHMEKRDIEDKLFDVDTILSSTVKDFIAESCLCSDEVQGADKGNTSKDSTVENNNNLASKFLEALKSEIEKI